MFATLARIFPRFRFRRTYCIHALHILSTLFNLFASVIVLNASRMDITRIHVSSSHSHYPLPHPPPAPPPPSFTIIPIPHQVTSLA